MLSDAELAEMRAVNRSQRNLTDDARLRERGIELRHPAKPPHEQWMHAGKKKAVAKTAAKLLAALGVDHSNLPAKTAKASAAPVRSRRVAGKDRVADIQRGALDVYARPDPLRPDDEVLSRIAQRQGFDGAPTVVSSDDFDRAVEQGWIETWRGQRAGVDGRSAADINSDLRQGPFRPGCGIFGNGIYATPRRATAEAYAADAADTLAFDSVVRIAIDPEARMIDYPDLMAEYRAWLRKQPDKGKLLESERFFFPKTAESASKKVFADVGRFAAARGYDVIRIPAKRGDGATNYRRGEPRREHYNVLNRTVLLVQEPEE